MILALNTSTLQFGLAFLEEDGTVLSEFLMSGGGRHFGSLMPALHFLLTSSKSDIHQINCIVVAVGPGSFTGLRVGLSAAKGLCHALQVPIIGISTLEAMASQITYSDIPTVPILHSRKDELFAAQFEWSNDHALTRIMDDTSVKFQDLPSLFQGPTLFIGNDFPSQGPLLKRMLGARALLAHPHLWNVKTSAIGFLGLRRFQAQDFDDPQGLNPVYLRPPDIRPSSFPIGTDASRQAGEDSGIGVL